MAKRKNSDNIDALQSEMNSILNKFEGNSVSDNNSDGNNSLSDILETPESVIADVDFFKLESDLESDAKELITILYNTYFDAGLLSRSELLKKKKVLDEMNLSNMLFQVKTIKMAIMSIMQVFQSGNPAAKLVESFSDLQLKFSEVTKNLANYMIFLETNYKNKQDELIDTFKSKGNLIENAANTSNDAKTDIYQENVQVEDSDSDDDDDAVLVNDPKKLVDMVKSDRPVNIENPRDINRPLTDPTRKEKLADEYDVKLNDVEDDMDYNVLNDELI